MAAAKQARAGAAGDGSRPCHTRTARPGFRLRREGGWSDKSSDTVTFTGSLWLDAAGAAPLCRNFTINASPVKAGTPSVDRAATFLRPSYYIWGSLRLRDAQIWEFGRFCRFPDISHRL